jgi:glycosyltransferase involved in cell wall biosynthesis
MTSTFYPPYHIGGDAVHVKYLADELVKRGHEVHVLHSLDAYNVKKKKSPEKAESDDIFTHPVKTRFNFSSYAAYAFGNSSAVNKEFESLVKQVKPDVVHHHNISLLGYDLLKKQGDYRNLYTAHDYWLICQQNNLLKNGKDICEHSTCFSCALKCKKTPQLWRHLKGFREAIQNIDILIAPSNYVRDKLSEYLGIETITLPNFAPELPDATEPSGFSNFFLYAGVLERHKGVLDLVNAYKEARDEITAQLLIVGSGRLNDEIKQFVKRNGLEGSVILLDWVDNNLLYRLLRDANALVIPSIWPENCPLIALEALSFGTPIIGSDKGGLPEIIKKIDSNLIFQSGAGLKDILTKLDKNNLSLPALKTYEKYYSPEAYIKLYLKMVS